MKEKSRQLKENNPYDYETPLVWEGSLNESNIPIGSIVNELIATKYISGTPADWEKFFPDGAFDSNRQLYFETILVNTRKEFDDSLNIVKTVLENLKTSDISRSMQPSTKPMTPPTSSSPELPVSTENLNTSQQVTSIFD